MKKLLSLAIYITTLLCFVLCFTSGGNAHKNGVAHAEIVTSSKLEYFELDKPLFAVRNEEKVFIAEKERIVIFYDDVYHEIVLKEKLPQTEVDFDIKNIAICANNLLILSNNTLYALNLETYTLAPLIYESDERVDFSSVHAFAVNGNHFVINDKNSAIFLFEITENGVELKSNYYGTITVAPTSHIALSNDFCVYYYGPTQDYNSLYYISNLGQNFYKFPLENANCFAFDNLLYFKAGNVIYSIGSDPSVDIPTTVIDLEMLGITDSVGFSVSNGKILICNTLNDCIVEYDIALGALTDFEISFTKISVPTDFEIKANFNPEYITVEKDELLYDINLPLSKTKGYFVFNGYHRQEKTSEYLVVATLSDLYYLVSGDVVALVLKENFTPMAIEKTAVNKPAYLTSSATTYRQPNLSNEFTSFKIEKLATVNILYTVQLRSVEYAILEYNGENAFLPMSFFVFELEKLPEYNTFETASTTNEEVFVFTSATCEEVQDTLSAFSKVMIVEKSDDVCKIIYNGKTGYILTSSLAKRGSFTIKIVAVILLLALSVFCSALYFEIKYLYTKKKRIAKK